MKQQKRNPHIIDILQKTNPGKNAQELYDAYEAKKKKYFIYCVVGGVVLALLLGIKNSQSREISSDGEILRNDYNGTAKEISAVVDSKTYGELEVTITATPQKYTASEVAALFEEAKDWLDQVILGENQSLDNVTCDLTFPSAYENTPIAISYASNDYRYLSNEGEVKNDDIDEEKEVLLTVKFSYEDYSQTEQYTVYVQPKQLTAAEQFEKGVMETLADANVGQQETETLSLPDSVDGEVITIKEKSDQTAWLIAALGLVCGFAIVKGMDNDLENVLKERQKNLLYEYPSFVTRLALLIETGLSVSGSIRRIYEKYKEEGTPLMEELGIYIHSLDNGVLEQTALTEFGFRTGLSEYRKFCNVLNSATKKGSINLREVLEGEATEAFLQHQIQVQKQGEEASTKLLIPMVLMLGVVMIVVMAPAFLSFQGV